MIDLLVGFIINEISCLYYFCVRYYGWFYKVIIYYDICMDSYIVRMFRFIEDVCVFLLWKMFFLKGNKYNGY